MTQDEVIKLVQGNQLPQYDRFRAHLAAKCDDASVSAVARDYGLNDETVRRIDKEFLAKRELITPNRTCEVLGIDEIAIRKGHVYLKEANDDVYTAYLLKEQVIAFYEQKSRGEAEDYLKKR